MIRPSPELEAIARRWLALASERDTEAALSLFSPSTALTYVGSAENEIWTDDVLRKGFAAMPRDLPRFHYEGIEVSAYENGPVGWAFWTATMFTPETGARVDFRGTILFELEKAAWRIVHVHNSNPVSNLQAMGYEPEVTFDDLLRATADSLPDFAQTGMASVMFTDIADSTALAQAIGDAAWSKIVKRHIELVDTRISQAGGTLVKSLGDGTMSTFPTARAAFTAAQSILLALSEDPGEPQLRVRIGIHTGEVIETGGDFFGTVVNKAARVAGIAAPDEIRVSDASRIMVGGSRDFVFSDPATLALKGLEGEHTIFRLEWRE